MVARADLEVVLKATDRATPTVKNLESSIIRFVGAVSAALAGLSAIAFPIIQAAQFEKELKNVQKTTGFLDDELKLLADDLINLSRTLTDSAADLAQIAAIAGQLGIRGRANIIGFTESISRAATALDLTAENAAIAGARILNIFQLDVSQLENVLSTINELSNTTTANAGQLIDTISRIGPVAGLQIQQVAALAATAIDLGVTPEVAGTSLVKVFSRIQSQAGKFAEALGIEIGDFIALGAEDRFKTFLEFLGKQSEVTRAELTRTLAGSGRIFSLVNKLVEDANSGFEQFNKNIVTSVKSFEDGTSAIREYENVSGALVNRLLNLRNNFVALSLEVGGALIPDLIDATARLNEFLQSDRAKAFATAVGDAFESIVTGAIDFLEFLTTLDINFQNLIATVRVFIALKIAQVFIGIGARILSATKALLVFEVAMIAASSAQATFAKTATAATAAAAVSAARATRLVGVVTKIVGVLSVGLRVAFPIVGLIVAGIALALSLSNDLFGGILKFFGFVSSDESKLAAERQAHLNELKKSAQAAAVEFRNVSQQAAAGAFAAPQEFRIDLDGGIEEFRESANKAGASVNTLVEGLAAAEAHIGNIAQREADALDQAKGLTAENVKLQKQYDDLDKKAEEELKTRRFISSEHTTQLRLIRENIELNDAQIAGLETQAGQLNSIGTAAVQAQDGLRGALRGTVATLQNTFSAPQLELVALTAELQSAERTTKKLKEESSDLTAELAKQNAALADAREEASATPAELKKMVDAINTTTEEIELNADTLVFAGAVTEEYKEQVADAAKELGAVGAALVEPLTAGLTNLNNGELAETPKRFREIAKSAGDSGASMEETAKEVTRLAIDLATLTEEQQKLVDSVAGQAAKDLSETAQGIFDNSARSVRAFRSDVIDLKRELETGLEDRVIDLRIRRRASEFDTRIEEAEQKKNDIIEDFQERIDNARNNAERIYLGRRKDEALSAIKTEIEQVESERAFLEEKALKDRFTRLQERVSDFVTEAKASAAAGNLDEALGLQDAAKTATKSLAGIISELQGLENVDPFGNVSFRVTKNEIKDLLAEFRGTERSVSDAIPIINRDLRDATKGAAEAFGAAEADIEARLKETNEDIEKLAKTVPNLTKILEDIGATLKNSEAFARLARFNPAGGGDLEAQLAAQAALGVQARTELQDTTKRISALIAAQGIQAVTTGEATQAGLLTKAIDNLKTLSALRDTALAEGNTGEAARFQREIDETNKLITAIEQNTLAVKQGNELVGQGALSTVRSQQIQINALLNQRTSLAASGGGVGQTALSQGEERELARLNAEIARLVTSVSSTLSSADQAELAAQVARGQVDVSAPSALRVLDPADSATQNNLTAGGLRFGTVAYKALLEDSRKKPLSAEIVGGSDTAADAPVRRRFGRPLAEGGHVTGPGTATSDSIPAMLSNGEYVIDAMTTRFMGSKFFAGLQALARGGRGKRLKMPGGFAAGGLVGSGALDGFSPVVPAGGFLSGSPVNITLPGGGELGLATGVSTVEDIKRVMANEARKVGRRVRR